MAAVATKGVDVVTEQVRGMKVRSSVKKLCEGCKVCLLVLFPRVLRGMWEGDCVYGFEGARLMRYSLLGGRAGRRGRDMCILSAR